MFVKKYQISDLIVITIPNKECAILNNKIICECVFDFIRGKGFYKEIFTKEKINNQDILKIENFSDYLPPILRINNPGYTKKQLLKYYNDMNMVNLLENIDEEDIKQYLDSRGILEESKIYKKTLN